MNSLKRCLILRRNIGKTLSPVLKKTLFKSCSTFSNVVNVNFNDNGFAEVIMHNPPANVLTLQLLKGLISAFSEAKEKNVKGMIIGSSYPSIFSAGLDIKTMYRPSEENLVTYWSTLQQMWYDLFTAPFLTVAAIPGHSPGGGCLIACSCDYRIMVKGNGEIGLNETKLGLGVPQWFADTFKTVLPNRIADVSLISGRMFKPEEALDVNLIDELADNNDDAIEKANKFLASLAVYSKTGMVNTKEIIRRPIVERFKENREDDIKNFLTFITDSEVQKTLEIYMNKLSIKK